MEFSHFSDQRAPSRPLDNTPRPLMGCVIQDGNSIRQAGNGADKFPIGVKLDASVMGITVHFQEAQLHRFALHVGQLPGGVDLVH